MLHRYLPASTAGRAAFWLTVAAGLLAGLVVGRGHAYNQSVGGMTAAFGGILFVFAAVGVLLFGIGAAVVARIVRAPHGTAGRALRLVLGAGVIGFVVGLVSAPLTGGTYREPVILQGTGATNAAVTSESTTFTPRADGEAACASRADSTVVGSITALELGELGDGTLRASLSLERPEGRHTLELFIDGADAENGLMTSWTGPASLTLTEPDGSSGSVSFSNHQALMDEGLPIPPPKWQGALSGTIEWTCEPFS